MADLFNKQVLKTHLNNHSIANYEEKMEIVCNWKRNLKSIIGANEEKLQASFLKGIFSVVLGYKDLTEAGEDGEYNLQIEPSTEVDATKPDGSLGFYHKDGQNQTEAVIELKGPKVSLDKKQKRAGKHYGTPVEQAFSYATKYDGCKWVIVSNMIEIRLYAVRRGQGYYEEFRIEELDQSGNFKKFHLLLSKENLISKQNESNTLRLSEQTEKQEEDISVEFYNLYKQIRVELFEYLKESNPNYEEDLLLEKAQKFLDRIIFVCFCEDLGLLPAELLHQAIERGKSSYSFSETTVWEEIKGVFKAINVGSERHNINAYNGGLFKEDEVLDNLVIKNDFFEVIDEISAYDFDSELDVNILGHVFEQSISDIEEIKADIENDEYREEESKRKKDGIYYTPEYITKYIVENSVGKYLEDIRKELGEDELPDIDSASTPQVEGKYKKKHLKFYREYEKRLNEIKILDPACGSGAFLNQAFDFLLREHQWIHKQIDLIQEGQRSIFGLESLQKQILQNNIYGVDINGSSVEITKLSLWLKTANKNKPLTNLDDNIKCGNSLIDDSEVAGEKAFDWEEEFSKIMADGGFDVVIGNPPYIRIQNMKEKIINHFKTYKTSYKNYDIYIIFVEKSYDLINENGYVSFIMPRKFINSDYGKKMKKFISSNNFLQEFLDFGDIQIFDDAITYTGIFLFSKDKKQYFNYRKVDSKYKLSNLRQIKQKKVNYKNIKNEMWLLKSDKERRVFEKLTENPDLEKIIEKAFQGLVTGADPVYILEINDDGLYSKFTDKKYNFDYDIVKPLLKGAEIDRYSTPIEKYKIIFPYKVQSDRANLLSKEELKEDYTSIWEYFKECENKLRSREGGKLDDEKWWRFSRTQNLTCFEQPKILTQVLAKKSSFTFEKDKRYYFVGGGTAGGYGVTLKENTKMSYKYLLALLNSSILEWYIKNYASSFKGGYYAYNKTTMEQLPIVKSEEQIVQKSLIKKVNFILEAERKTNKLSNNKFTDLINKYTSNTGSQLSNIVEKDGFYNKIYSGRARKVRNMMVNINDAILTIYADKSSSGQYELMKFEVEDKYKRQYIKYYLENFTDEQLEEVNDLSGGLVNKVLQIELSDYDKYQVVRKVVNEWRQLQRKIDDLKEKIKVTDQEIDQMVYELYGLTEKEIKIVEESLNDD